MWDRRRDHVRWWPVVACVAAAVSLASCADESGVDDVEPTAESTAGETSVAGGPDDAVVAPGGSVTPADDTADPVVTDAATPDSLDAATGSGVAVHEGDEYDFEVVACGWAAGDADPDQQLASTPGDRRLFQLVGVGRDGDAVFFLGLSWDGGVGNVEASVGHTGSPTFLASGGLNPTSSVEIDDSRIVTTRPLAVRAVGDTSASSLEVEATCDRFGGSFGGMEQLLEQATGQQVISPEERGGAGTLVIDGEELPVEVESCDDRDVVVTVRASAPDGTWLHVLAADSGPDEVAVGREGDRIGADARGDLVERDGDRLRSTRPITLNDKVDGTPAETVTLDVSCA